MSNKPKTIFRSEAAKAALDVARRAGLLGSAHDLLAQAAYYDEIAETESVLDWPARLRLATAAAALRHCASLLEKVAA